LRDKRSASSANDELMMTYPRAPAPQISLNIVIILKRISYLRADIPKLFKIAIVI
jgi:hypothetical protein